MANNISNNRTLGTINGNTFSSASTDGINNVSVGNQNISGNTDFDGYSFQQNDVSAGQYVLNASGAGLITFTPFSGGGGAVIYGGYTPGSFKTEMLAGGLTAGSLYNIYATSSNSPTSGISITTEYDIFVLAVGTSSISQSAKRRMRVPKQSMYNGSYWGKSFPAAGQKRVISNWVYDNQTGSQGTVNYYTTLDSTNWTLVDPSDSAYYETRVYDVIINNDPSLSDAYFLRIEVQWDERANRVVSNPTQSSFATNATTGFALNGSWQTTCDFNEWNNPYILNNDTYGIWANRDFDSGRSTTIHANRMFFYQGRPTTGVTEQNAEPFINNNSAEFIGGNQVEGFSIRDNVNCERIHGNRVVGYIKNNAAIEAMEYIADNTIWGVYDTSSLNYGIVDNDGPSKIVLNMAQSISSNTNSNSYIIGNIVNRGQIKNNSNTHIEGNLVTGDISNNSNTGAIERNRCAGKKVSGNIAGTYRAIYNNGSGVSDILDNDCLYIQNNG